MPYFIAILMFAVSAVVRVWIYGTGDWVENIDAPYHVLVIMRAWSETPASIHHFLPLMSFGGPMDKGIVWGGLPSDAFGNFYYLSFPALGFFAPYIAHAALGIVPTLMSLMVFNFTIHLACTLLVVALVGEVWRALHFSSRDEWQAQIPAAATYLFCFELMFAHGPTYWGQSLFQIAFLAALFVFWRFMEWPSTRRLVSLAALCFLASAIEWTGYVFTGGIVFTLLYLAWRERSSLMVIAALACGGAAALALLFYAVQIVSVLGFSDSLAHLLSRFSGRSGTTQTALMALYANGFLHSFALLPFLAVAGFVLIRRMLPQRMALLLFVALFPILENIILLQHAVAYYFDRAKLVVPIILALSCWLALTTRRDFVAAAWVVAILSNIAVLLYAPRTIRTGIVTAAEQKFWQSLSEFNKPCTVVTTSTVVRGYYNTMTGRSIYEGVMSQDAMRAITNARRACLGIWLTSVVAPTGWWDQAFIYDPATGQTRLISRPPI